MKILAINLPGGNNIPMPSGLKTNFVDLGSFIGPLLEITFYIAMFLTFYWLIWGAWAYLFSNGEKENLAKARARIRYALIGLAVIFMAYFLVRFAGEVFPPSQGVPF